MSSSRLTAQDLRTLAVAWSAARSGDKLHGRGVATLSIPQLARDQMASARSSSQGRSTTTICGDREHELRQDLVALATGRRFDPRSEQGAVSAYVVKGRVRVQGRGVIRDAAAGEFIAMTESPCVLTALEDAVILQTSVSAEGRKG